jgi:hypothetical protein
MTSLRIAILACVLIEAGWMAFDGTRALVVGELITPRDGPHRGELGPWRHIVARLGINPSGTLMKVIFSVYGWTWLILAVAFALGAGWSWVAMVVAAAGALWFLPIGTVLSVVQLVLLVLLRARS